MNCKHLTSSRSNTREDGEEGRSNRLSGEVKLGDLIWISLRGSSWWPAQVVDANTVSDSIKPSNRSVGEVLVRLYGSYEYLFVDPMKSRLEFEQVLKQNNGSYREIFHKSLERDRRHSNSSGSKGKGSNSKEIKVEALTARKLTQNLLEDNHAIVASESRIGMLEGPADIVAWSTIAQTARLVAESLKDDVSEDEEIPPRSVKYLARVSPRRPRTGNASPTMERDGFTLLDSPEEQVIIKTSKKDGGKNKLSCCSSLSFEQEMKNKPGKQNKVLEKLMPYSPSAKDAKSRTPEKGVLLKKHKPNPMTPPSAAPSSGNSEELSGRRVKVMQSLGLAAPSGSLFCRVG